MKSPGSTTCLQDARIGAKEPPSRAWKCLFRIPAPLRNAALACVALLFQAPLAEGSNQAKAAGCGGEEILRAQVQSVLDARTVVLDTTETVRLAGLELAEGQGGDAATAPDTQAAQIETLLAGREVILRRADKHARDRYGRILAIASFADTGESVQETLIGEGHALVSPLLDNPECFRIFLAAENAARLKHAGLWAQSAVTKRAGIAAEMAARSGHFVVAEGTVLSVREAGTTIYVNFGRKWSRDFSVNIPKRLAKTFQTAGIPPQSLENKRIRVRGWIELRGAAARLRATHPQQIEALGD